ncbi:Prephenate dehydratase domain-containing protein [Mycena sanguinolenta]|uniref:prephenate dehydratase n=1 Tax=Mycena sanguinolenta TaxID=230812 RepID=A0A8H6YKD6_9AGAR|nr:Prephenate dehydratase domain-containing protein [Mycena sanguinolenta]
MHGTPFTVAFLGPLGTYSHQAAYDRFGNTVGYYECKTITEVFNAIASKAVQAGVIPQENSIYGTVIETYDALRKQNVGFIRGEIVLKVQHCLLVRGGVKPEEIQCIKSHEQALGQCRGFLTKNFPNASLEKMASTAAAAEAILTSPKCAAICSKLCATLFNGLEILYEGIQDQNSNFTRFHVLTATQDVELPPPAYPAPSQTHGLVRLTARRDVTPRAPPINQILAALDLTVSRLDRRPQLDSPFPFCDVYFAELEKGDSSASWHSAVEDAMKRVKALGVEAELLGLW